MPAAFIRVEPLSSSGGSHWPWIGRSTAALTAKALSHSMARRGRGVGRAGGHHHVLHAIEQHRGARHFGQLLGVLCATVRPAASDWPIAQNLQLFLRLS
jgi:hypothetical protein